MSLAVNELHFSWAANISPASHCSWCEPIFMLSSYFKPRKIIFRGSFCFLGFSCGELHQSASFYRSYFHMPGRKGWERVRNWWTNLFFFFLSPERMGRGELKFSDLLNHSCSSLQKLWKLQRRKSKNSTNFLRSLDDQLCSGQPGGDNNLPQRGSPSEMPHQRL